MTVLTQEGHAEDFNSRELEEEELQRQRQRRQTAGCEVGRRGRPLGRAWQHAIGGATDEEWQQGGRALPPSLKYTERDTSGAAH